MSLDAQRAGTACEERELFQRAMERWGVPAQLDMLLEEMAELAVAVNHYRRGRASWVDVCREAADVGIMLGQLREMPCTTAGAAPSTEYHYTRFREDAIRRLRVRLGHKDERKED